MESTSLPVSQPQTPNHGHHQRSTTAHSESSSHMSSTSMYYLPWPWPWFGLLGMFLFLNNFGLTSFTKVWPTLLAGTVLMQPAAVNMKTTHIQFSFEFRCIRISVTMIPVLRETLIWVPSVLVRASIFSPLFIPCSTCGQ